MKGTSSDDPRSGGFALSRNRFPFLFAGADLALTISKVGLYAVPPAGTAQSPVFPDTLALFAPAGVAALTPDGAASIGPLVGQTFAAGDVVVADEDAGAIWKLELPAADLAAFQEGVDDVLVVCQYVVASA